MDPEGRELVAWLTEARARETRQHLLRYLVLSAAAAAALFVLLEGLARAGTRALPHPTWLPYLPVAAAAGAFLAGTGWGWVRVRRAHPDLLTTARRVEGALRLEERLSTALELVSRGNEAAAWPLGAGLLRDARRHLGRLQPGRACEAAIPREAGTLLALAAAAAVAFQVLPPLWGPAAASHGSGAAQHLPPGAARAGDVFLVPSAVSRSPAPVHPGLEGSARNRQPVRPPEEGGEPPAATGGVAGAGGSAAGAGPGGAGGDYGIAEPLPGGDGGSFSHGGPGSAGGAGAGDPQPDAASPARKSPEASPPGPAGERQASREPRARRLEPADREGADPAGAGAAAARAGNPGKPGQRAGKGKSTGEAAGQLPAELARPGQQSPDPSGGKQQAETLVPAASSNPGAPAAARQAGRTPQDGARSKGGSGGQEAGSGTGKPPGSGPAPTPAEEDLPPPAAAERVDLPAGGGAGRRLEVLVAPAPGTGPRRQDDGSGAAVPAGAGWTRQAEAAVSDAFTPLLAEDVITRYFTPEPREE